MEMPKNISTILWSAAGGAALAMVVGFSWGGWVTGGTARKDAATAAHDAVVVALAPICAERFRSQGDAPAKIAELAKESSWQRGNVIEKSGYALMPGSKTTDSDVARACAEMLATPPTPKT
jgi:alpha/beta superfamily hydrolase